MTSRPSPKFLDFPISTRKHAFNGGFETRNSIVRVAEQFCLVNGGDEGGWIAEIRASVKLFEKPILVLSRCPHQFFSLRKSGG